jgi:DNA repair exonuclease SbcCD ATPase subunit
VPTPVPAPAPAPAPAPQTGPSGIPSSDPTKTQPGETGPFDPNAEPPAPAPAPAPEPEPEAELAPPKPLQDTKEPAPEPEGITTFTFFRGDEMGDANPAALYNRADSVEFTRDQLEEYFNEEGSGMLRQAFGSFSNYLGYMTEREQLIQSGDYDVGDWPDYQGGLTDDELMLLEGEDLTQFGDDAASDMPELEQRRLLEQSSAYDRWVNSEANQALLKKYGVNSISYNQDGDKFEWNGSAFVKTVKVDDHAGVGDYVKAGILTAMNYFAGGALTEALTKAGMSATLASGTSSGILNAATQYASTGTVDFGEALDSAISAGLSTEIINQLSDAGVFDEIKESLNNLTQDTVQLADGTELPYNGILVELADGSTVAIGDFLTQAAEAGNPVVAEITRSLPEFLETIGDAFEASGAAQGVVNILEGMTTETQPYPGSSAPQVTINVPEGVTPEAEEAEVPPEENIFTDTTQEATGLEESILSDLLGEYLEPIRGEITQSEERIISQTQEFIASAIANLPPNATQEEIRAIVQNVIENAPQAETLSEEQVDVLVNSAVDAVRADLQTGLETAETERQEIIAGQQAIRSELGSDIEALETRLNDLPPEIRTIVSEEIEDLATISDVNAVQQSINALEQLVNNIQPGTTPEQVRQEIQDAGLATSEELQTTAEGLFAALEAMAEGQTVALTTAQSELLAEIAEGDAETIRELSQLEGRLEDYLEEQNTSFTEVTSELSDDIENLRVGLSEAEQDRQRLMEAIVEARGETADLSQEMRDLLAESNQTIQEMFEDAGVDIDELRSGQLSQEEATNALREYSEQTRQELISGLDEASEERLRIEESTNDKLEQLREGIAVQFTDAEARRLEELTGLEARLLQDSAENAAEFNDLLANQGVRFEEVTDALRSDILESEERLGDRITGLEQQMDADAIARLAELTGLREEFLETLTANEAAAIARNEGLSDQITEQITGIRGETARQIEGMDERLTQRISEYEAQTGDQLDIAAEERAVLGGQLGTLTSDVAQVAEDLIRADGRIEELDEASRERFDELGLSIEDLSLRVGVNLEALQTGMLTQDAALRELIEESTTQTEESLTQRLEQAEEGFATSLSDTEANLLSQITGVEAGVLQQLATVEGGLRSQFGEQFGQVQEQVAGLGEQVTGIGEQVAGVGEGLGQLGQALGTGLLGLAAAQPTAQQIASAMPRQPVKFDPFLKGLDPFQPLTPLTLRPIQEKDAVSELNKFIGRQTGMLV